MWISCLTPSNDRRVSLKAWGVGAVLLGLAACPGSIRAQVVVFDPKNHLENALQAARQLESLANEARVLANQARELASSPYSHLAETSQALNDIGELARSAKGLASDVEGLQADFADLYPAVVQGADPLAVLEQRQARNDQARETALDLASTAARLEHLARERPRRLQGALTASQSATGQTAAIQSSTQVLAVLAEDLSSMRGILGAQSRLLAQEAARRSAERAASAQARRRFWGNEGATPPNPDFNPLPHARTW